MNILVMKSTLCYKCGKRLLDFQSRQQKEKPKRDDVTGEFRLVKSSILVNSDGEVTFRVMSSWIFLFLSSFLPILQG